MLETPLHDTPLEDLERYGGPFISVTAGAQYDLRFTHQPHEWFWSVLVGAGYAFSSR